MSAKGKAAMKDHQLDINKTLAERNERRLRELELNGPSEDSLLPTPTLSDSLFETTFSHSQPTTEKKLDSLVTLKVFDSKQVFRLFDANRVNFSWLQKGSKIPDTPAHLSPLNLVGYIESELVAKHCQRTKNTALEVCRYLFYLASVTPSSEVLHTCAKILEEKMTDGRSPFCISVPDLLAVLINYGTIKSNLWPEEEQIDFPPIFKLELLDNFSPRLATDFPLPRANLEKVLNLLRYNISVHPRFTDSEKTCLFHVMLNLLMANFIVGDYFLVLAIKDVMSSILESYSEEEWKELELKRVEDLVLQCWSGKLDPIGIVQRISSIPTTSRRGIQLQQSAAFFAAQHLMDLEEVILCGQVLVDDVIKLLDKLNCPSSDFRTMFCIVTLISLTLDLSEPTKDKEKIENLARALNDARHEIRDVTNDLDLNRLAVKDLMCEIATLWKDSIPKENVV